MSDVVCRALTVRPFYGGNSLTRSGLRRKALSDPASAAIRDVMGTRGDELSAAAVYLTGTCCLLRICNTVEVKKSKGRFANLG